MRFEKYDFTEVHKFYKPTKNYVLVKEFASSGLECAILRDWKHSSAYNCVASLNNSIKRFKIAGIKAVCANGQVYLIRTDRG